MAIVDGIPTTTAACDLGRHQSCRKVVLSLTAGHGAPCACDCHGKEAGQVVAAGLPAAFADLVFTFPPCDEDVDLVDDEEVAADAAADLLLERSLEDIHFAEGWS